MPPHWRTAKDADGKTYYYHAITRETQWDPPEEPGSRPAPAQPVQSETPASPVKPVVQQQQQQPIQRGRPKESFESPQKPQKVIRPWFLN